LNEGKVLALDTPDSLLELLPGELASIQCADPRGARDRIRSLPGVKSTALFGNSVHALLATAGAEGLRTLEAHLREVGITPTSLEMVEPSLEDVFLHLVREAAHA
jgi:ABC-2 type transport system ATP-binding protein